MTDDTKAPTAEEQIASWKNTAAGPVSRPWEHHALVQLGVAADLCERLLKERDEARATDARHVDFYERKEIDLRGIIRTTQLNLSDAQAKLAAAESVILSANDIDVGRLETIRAVRELAKKAEARIVKLEAVREAADGVCFEQMIKNQMLCFNMGTRLLEALDACEEKIT